MYYAFFRLVKFHSSKNTGINHNMNNSPIYTHTHL